MTEWAAVFDNLQAAAAAVDHIMAGAVRRLEPDPRIDIVRLLRRPDQFDGMGYGPNGHYGNLGPVCQTCGTPDEYGVPWPCPTFIALGDENRA